MSGSSEESPDCRQKCGHQQLVARAYRLGHSELITGESSDSWEQAQG